jgi:hypothetical protein
LTKNTFTSISEHAHALNPVFFDYSLAKGGLASMDDPYADHHNHHYHDQYNSNKPHPVHPAFHGYAMSRHRSDIISPIFMGMHFRKKQVQERDDEGVDEADSDIRWIISTSRTNTGNYCL